MYFWTYLWYSFSFGHIFVKPSFFFLLGSETKGFRNDSMKSLVQMKQLRISLKCLFFFFLQILFHRRSCFFFLVLLDDWVNFIKKATHDRYAIFRWHKYKQQSTTNSCYLILQINTLSKFLTIKHNTLLLLKNENDIPHLVHKTQFWMEFLIFKPWLEDLLWSQAILQMVVLNYISKGRFENQII